jgi:hypothetical protein
MWFYFLLGMFVGLSVSGVVSFLALKMIVDTVPPPRW